MDGEDVVGSKVLDSKKEKEKSKVPAISKEEVKEKSEVPDIKKKEVKKKSKVPDSKKEEVKEKNKVPDISKDETKKKKKVPISKEEVKEKSKVPDIKKVEDKAKSKVPDICKQENIATSKVPEINEDEVMEKSKVPALSKEEDAFLDALKSSQLPLDENLITAHFPGLNTNWWTSGLGLLSSSADAGQLELEASDHEGPLAGWMKDNPDWGRYSHVFTLRLVPRNVQSVLSTCHIYILEFFYYF